MDESFWCHCNSCGRPTDHAPVFHEVVEDVEVLKFDPRGYDYEMVYDLLRCRGCHHLCLRKVFRVGGDDLFVNFYPPPIARYPPEWRTALPAEMLELLEEVYTALHNNASRLALVGTRTLVDLLILERVGDVGTFKEKLKRLVEAGVLTGQGSDVLYAALDAGSAVAHRGLKPEPEVVTAVIEIIENVLQAAYHLGGVAKHLRLATPPRPSKR